MIRVMIVDDEMLVRTGIKSLIDWNKHEYLLVGDAGNGDEAKKKIKDYLPDIILTDLMMSPVDGFELIRYCKKEFPQIKLVVLSNYNDFENVRKAMKLGASDYLFKLMIKPDELLAVLQEVSKDIKEQRSSEANQVIQKNIDSIKSGILKQLESSNSGFAYNVKELFNEVPLKVDLEQDYCILRLWIDNFEIVRKKESYSKMDLILFTIQNMIDEILSRAYQVEVFLSKEGEFVCFLNIQSENEKREHMNETCMVLADYIYRFSGIMVSMALSVRAVGYEALRGVLQETQDIRDVSFLQKRDCVLTGVEWTWDCIPETFSQEKMSGFMEQGNIREAFQQWRQFFLYLSNNRNTDPMQVKRYLRKFYLLMEYLCQRHQIDTELIFDKNGVSLEDAINSYDRFEDLQISVYELLDEYDKVYCGIRKGRCRKEVDEAKRYIKSHLQESISLDSMATLVNMSKSRFSHVFKEDTGVTPGEYINEKRMNMAARLLKETDLKISEISDAVGIDNSNYFSTQFRKKFNLSPIEYRRRED